MKKQSLALESVVLTRGMTAIRLMPIIDKPFFSSDETELIRDIIGALLNMGVKIHANTKMQITFENKEDIENSEL